MTPEQEIRTLIHEINQSWLEGRLDRLSRNLHPKIVMVAPGFQGRVAGAEACLKSFEEFLARAKIRDFKESEVVVDSFGPAAVATFRFDISYAMDGQDYEESGREIWVFARGEQGWQAVWRTRVPIEQKS